VQHGPVRLDPVHGDAAAQHPGGHRAAEHVEQVGPVQHGRWPVPAGQFGSVGAGQPPAGRIPDAGLAFQHGAAADGITHPERIQRPQRVGPQRQPRADLGELRGTFQHLGLPAAAAQGQRTGQPADPAADDDRLHESSPGLDTRPLIPVPAVAGARHRPTRGFARAPG
jgi:hypothetical protein